MGFVRPTGRNRRQTALFGAFAAIVAALLLGAAPAQATLSDEARAEIDHQRGAHALRAGEPAEAIEWFDKALALQPDRADSLALKSRALLELGRAEEAEAVTEKVRELRPDDYDVTFLLALTAYRQQDWISAQRYLEEARGQNPNDPRVRLYLGRTYQELGADSQAEAELLEAARLDPDFRAPASFRLGILHLQRGEQKQAKARFKEVSQLAPGSELAGQAELYLKLMAATQPKRVNAWVRLEGAWDSNVTLGGNGDLVDSSDESAWRAAVEIGANIRLFTWNGLTMRVGATNYASYHPYTSSTLHDFDIEQTRPWLLTTWQPLEWLAFDTRFTHERVYRNLESFKVANYVSPAIRILPKPGWVTRLFGEYENRNYINAFEDIQSRDRDGWVGTLGLDQYMPVPNPFADGIAYLRLGYRFRNEDSHGVHFDSQSHKPLATLFFSLHWNMDISFDASWERRDFRRPSIFEAVREILQETGNAGGTFANLPLTIGGPFGQPVGCYWIPPDPTMGLPENEYLGRCNSNNRLDKITQARVRLRKNIGKSWTLETYYRWVDWDSTTEEFKFHRHIVGLAATFRR